MANKESITEEAYPSQKLAELEDRLERVVAARENLSDCELPEIPKLLKKCDALVDKLTGQILDEMVASGLLRKNGDVYEAARVN